VFRLNTLAQHMHNYLRLFSYVRRQRGFLTLIFLLTIVAAGLAALQPWPLKLLIDNVLGNAPLAAPIEIVLRGLSIAPSNTVMLLLVVVGGLVLFTLGAAVDAGLTWGWTAAGRRMVYQLSADLFARLQRQSLRFHQHMRVGDVMGRVTTDSWCVYEMADALLFTPVYAFLTAIAMIVLMAQLDPALTLLAVGMAPLTVAASFLLGKPLRAVAKLRREVETRIQAHLQQALTGIAVVQAFGQEERESARFSTSAGTAIRTLQRSAIFGALNSLTSGLVAALGSGVVLWIGARHVLEGRLTLGSLLVFLVYLGSLQVQTKIFASLYARAQSVSASVHRVVAVLDAPVEIADTAGAAVLPPIRGEVRFENVTAGHEPGIPVLKDVSFTARPGQTIAIVGATGAGKTTLVNLIPRFVDRWQGRVLIDGHDVRDVCLKTLRSQTAVVLQDPFLFPFSIAENIAYGKPDATRAEIEAAARAANAHEFITALPQGYDTVIGERGATLSGGERQRLAIARALVRDPAILILDEPTSALDPGTERLILQALQQVAAGRTTFIIAHRLSTVRRANCILVIEDGRLAESGSHEELLAMNGCYARLQKMQNSPHLRSSAIST
jgi:ATP-binding cassette subfamily B protein